MRLAGLSITELAVAAWLGEDVRTYVLTYAAPQHAAAFEAGRLLLCSYADIKQHELHIAMQLVWYVTDGIIGMYHAHLMMKTQKSRHYKVVLHAQKVDALQYCFILHS